MHYYIFCFKTDVSLVCFLCLYCDIFNFKLQTCVTSWRCFWKGWLKWLKGFFVWGRHISVLLTQTQFYCLLSYVLHTSMKYDMLIDISAYQQFFQNINNYQIVYTKKLTDSVTVWRLCTLPAVSRWANCCVLYKCVFFVYVSVTAYLLLCWEHLQVVQSLI